MRMFPELFQKLNIEPVDNYSSYLLDILKTLTPRNCDSEPNVVILTPGPLNSAYYEHSYLADTMGIELVQGSDLFVKDNITFMRTTEGKQRVDIIYRRIDDDFIDPLTFNHTSVIGVPGLFDSYRAGFVNICSAPGSGIADDKAIYSYMPDIIRFYLGQEPILPIIKTYKCANKNDKNYVLKNLDKLVVKEAYCGKQVVMKRFRARAKGRAAEIMKPYSNLTIILTEKEKQTEKHGTKSKSSRS